jgi:uncharacterized protein involved in exopolysaccharide biosynthesis
MKTYLTRMPWFVAGVIILGIAASITAALAGNWLNAWTVLVITGLLAYNEALNQVNVDLRKQRDIARDALIELRVRAAARYPRADWED